MAHIDLIIGPVGAGKSIYASKLAVSKNAMRFSLDAWFARLFSPDRASQDLMSWYPERASRCIDQIWEVSKELLEMGIDVVLEIGLIQAGQREAFYEKVRACECDLTVHVVDANREVRRERVLRRNQEKGATFSMVVPPEIFELASNLWEPPGEIECRDFSFNFVNG